MILRLSDRREDGIVGEWMYYYEAAGQEDW
jgi:hypothetical protein